MTINIQNTQTDTIARTLTATEQSKAAPSNAKRGEQSLSQFQDNEKSLSTILSTSQKLSTGVYARNMRIVRNIVLMRPVNSMIEFKQIIGRCTRLHDGKDYFTIHDFVNAYHLFSDPEWGDEPVEPEPPTTKPLPPSWQPPNPTELPATWQLCNSR